MARLHASDLSDIDLRSKRLGQLTVILAVALLATLATSAADKDWVTSAWLASGLGFVALSYGLNRSGRTHAASLTVLWTLTVVASMTMWSNQGPYSPALLAYPCILVIANMLAPVRTFFALFAYMMASLGVMTYASVSGLHRFSFSPYGLPQLSYSSVVLAAGMAAIYLLGGDLRSALVRLKAEVARVNASAARLSYMAEHDALTDLPNRALGRALFDAALASARRRGTRVALMFVDIDNFKSVNDSLGHSAGDELLRQVSDRLKLSVDEPDAVIRHGGDQFLVVASDAVDAGDVSGAASQLLDSFASPFEVNGLAVATSCSIGIAMFPDDGDDFDALLKKSDIAAHDAKQSGRNVFRFFDEAMNAGMLEDLNINTGLRQALERGEFSLHYQPVVDLAAGRVIGAEALLRWEHPDKGMILPGRFIPVAERSGLIIDIGQWVLDEACRQIRAWERSGDLAGLIVSINISTIQFKRGNIDTVVGQALQAHDVPPGSLELEVTESALIHDAEGFVETLRRLKDLGLRLAIDDFGTGYSNLSYLQRFAVGKLKIDQSFVRRLNSTTQDHAIVRAIIQMAKSLNLKTVAEGVEDDATRRELIALGCDQAQGYFLGRPVPLAQFERVWAPQSLRSCPQGAPP
ncbi:MAG TPA: EAL domain-containing protein [Albitalea sp.]|nr:EAL domain-containing protein [Albitalea sp.]